MIFRDPAVYKISGGAAGTEGRNCNSGDGGATSYRDQTRYWTVHFHGARLHEALGAASEFLKSLEEKLGRPPHVLCVHDEISSVDEGSDVFWQFSIILGETADI